MLETNVKQFASELGLQPDHLLEQLRAAGVGKSSMEDVLTEQEKPSCATICVAPMAAP